MNDKIRANRIDRKIIMFSIKPLGSVRLRPGPFLPDIISKQRIITEQTKIFNLALNKINKKKDITNVSEPEIKSSLLKSMIHLHMRDRKHSCDEGQ